MTADTPRTDALLKPNGALATNLLEHARQLERELSEAKKDADLQFERVEHAWKLLFEYRAKVKGLEAHLLKSLTIADQSIELWKETLDVAKQLKP